MKKKIGGRKFGTLSKVLTRRSLGPVTQWASAIGECSAKRTAAYMPAEDVATSFRCSVIV